MSKPKPVTPEELAAWRRGWAKGCLVMLLLCVAFGLLLWGLDALGWGDIDNIQPYHFF